MRTQSMSAAVKRESGDADGGVAKKAKVLPSPDAASTKTTSIPAPAGAKSNHASTKVQHNIVPFLGLSTNNTHFNDQFSNQSFSFDDQLSYDKSVVRKIMRMNELKASINNEIFKIDASKNDFGEHFFSESIIKDAINNPALYNGLSNAAKSLMSKACELLLIEMSAFCVVRAQEKNKVVVDLDDLLHFISQTEQYDFMCAHVCEK